MVTGAWILILLYMAVILFFVIRGASKIKNISDYALGNILFFGNFANLDKDQFTEGILELVQDRQVLYETMIHNIHDIGLVLKTKFALLKIAYNAFMAALVAGVLSFIAVFVWILQQAG